LPRRPAIGSAIEIEIQNLKKSLLSWSPYMDLGSRILLWSEQDHFFAIIREEVKEDGSHGKERLESLFSGSP